MKIIAFLILLFTITSTKAQTGIYPYYDGNKWGLTNNNLEILVKPRFDKEFEFKRDLFAMVVSDNKWGAINRQGKITVPCSYDMLKPIYGIIGQAKKDDQLMLLNLLTGKPIENLDINNLVASCRCDKNILLIEKDKKRGFLNGDDGKNIGSVVYDKADFMRKIPLKAEIFRAGKWGVLDLKTGKEIIKPAYDRITTDYDYKTGKRFIVGIVTGGYKTYFNENGKEVKRPAPAEEAAVLEETSIMVEEVPSEETGYARNKSLHVYNQGNGNWKITVEVTAVNSKEIIETRMVKGYEKLEAIKYSSAGNQPAELKATKNGKTGIIDWSGKVLIPFEYDNILNMAGYYLTKLGDKTGMINGHYVVIKPPVLKKINKMNYYLQAWQIEMPDGKKGYMNKENGTIYIPGIKE